MRLVPGDGEAAVGLARLRRCLVHLEVDWDALTEAQLYRKDVASVTAVMCRSDGGASGERGGTRTSVPKSGIFPIPMEVRIRDPMLKLEGARTQIAKKSKNELWLTSTKAGRPDAPICDHAAECRSVSTRSCGQSAMTT